MVILQPEDNVKVKTVKQQACITRLLQSSYFSKREFIELMRRNRNQIITSYDASVLISYLISVLRFRKKFLSKKHKAHLKCDFCSDRKYLTRYYVPTYNAQKVMCMKCEDQEQEALEQSPGFQEAANELKKNLKEDLAKPCNKDLVLNVGGVKFDKDSFSEIKEASADLYRKYDYPGGDVDMKIDINKEAQDQAEEVKRANGATEAAYYDKQTAKAFVKTFNNLSDDAKKATLQPQNKPSALQ